MSGIFIKEVTIKNFKCFEDRSFELAMPDGSTEGSGLNVLIGENGNGKTAVLEAINYTNQSAYATENRLQIHDFFDHTKDVVITAKTSAFSCKMGAPYFDCTFDCEGIEFTAKSRDRKSPGRLLSSPFQIRTVFTTVGSTYRNKNGDDSGKPIPALSKTFSNDSIDGSELNVFYFDKNRTRHLSLGNYRTTFERICDDLNWKFLKKLDEDEAKKRSLLENISGEYFTTVLNIAQKGTGKKLANEVSQFFGQDQFKSLGIDFVDLLHPFSSSFFAMRKESELKQIRPRELGSGIEMILTLLLLRGIASESKGGIVYLLDEPELHLHPKAQQSLVSLLLEESKTKQIVISTHSPYLIKGCMLSSVNKIILRRDHAQQIEIQNASRVPWGTFPWSPSWGEVNFVAYQMPTVEYHNELYGWLQEKHLLSDELTTENYLSTNGVPKAKTWKRLKGGVVQSPYPTTLCTYVRNSIHHPENSHNPPFTESELMQSILELRRLI